MYGLQLPKFLSIAVLAVEFWGLKSINPPQMAKVGKHCLREKSLVLKLACSSQVHSEHWSTSSVDYVVLGRGSAGSVSPEGLRLEKLWQSSSRASSVLGLVFRSALALGGSSSDSSQLRLEGQSQLKIERPNNMFCNFLHFGKIQSLVRNQRSWNASLQLAEKWGEITFPLGIHSISLGLQQKIPYWSYGFNIRGIGNTICTEDWSYWA